MLYGVSLDVKPQLATQQQQQTTVRCSVVQRRASETRGVSMTQAVRKRIACRKDHLLHTAAASPLTHWITASG